MPIIANFGGGGGGGSAPIICKNTIIGSTAWVDSTTYAEYPYSATITVDGVTEDYVPEISFGAQDMENYFFAPVASCGENSVTIYAGYVPDTIIVPTMMFTVGDTISGIDPILGNNDWATISAVSQAGLASSYWNVGDTKAVHLSGTIGTLDIDQTLYVYILGFDHNSDLEGKGITFGGFKTAASGGTDVCLVDSCYADYESYNGTKYFQMNHRNSSLYGSNYGGWAASDIRYDILGSTDNAPSGYGSDKTTSVTGNNPSSACAMNPVANTLMAALPSDLRVVMKATTKYTDNTGGATNTDACVTATLDYLPFLSEFEVFGARHYANEYEQNYQQQYDYYKNGNSRIKYTHNATRSTAYWWARSPYSYSGTDFCTVNYNGNAGRNSASYSFGIAPAFVV